MPGTLLKRAARRWHARASDRAWCVAWMSSDPCAGQGLGVLTGAVLRAASSTWGAAVAFEKIMLLPAAGAALKRAADEQVG